MMMEGRDYFIQVSDDIPGYTPALTVKEGDYYLIYINAKLSVEEQEQAALHELKHTVRGDHADNRPLETVEPYRRILDGDEPVSPVISEPTVAAHSPRTDNQPIADKPAPPIHPFLHPDYPNMTREEFDRMEQAYRDYQFMQRIKKERRENPDAPKPGSNRELYELWKAMSGRANYPHVTKRALHRSKLDI